MSSYLNRAEGIRKKAPKYKDARPTDPLTIVGAMPVLSFWLLLAALGLVWLSMLRSHGGAPDLAIFNRLYVGGTPWLRSLADWVTDFGTRHIYLPVVACAALLLAWRRNPAGMILVIVVPATCRRLVDLEKAHFALPRPYPAWDLTTVHSFAYPSGHSANSMAAYLTAALLIGGTASWRRWPIAIAIALSGMIGVSRLMLGVHWPSDVAGGWAFGCFWALAWLRLAELVSLTWRNRSIDNLPWPSSLRKTPAE